MDLWTTTAFITRLQFKNAPRRVLEAFGPESVVIYLLIKKCTLRGGDGGQGALFFYHFTLNNAPQPPLCGVFLNGGVSENHT